MAYQYTPLDSAGSQIRLLTVHVDIKQVLGRSNVKPLSGTLSNYYLPVATLSRTRRLVLSSKIGYYLALSYVWGDPTKTHEIILDGKTLRITENLYNRLRAVQKSVPANFNIWADAICINQEDDEEKSAQILLMREIYHSATYVRIWLGPGSDVAKRCLDFVDKLTWALLVTYESEDKEDSAMDEALVKPWLATGEFLGNTFIRIGQAVSIVNDIQDPAARNDAKLLTPDEDLSLHQASIEGVSDWRPSERRLRKVEYEGDFVEIAHLLGALFIQNDWFSKMWVVQEVGAAEDVEFQVGGVAVNWRYVVRALYYLHFTRDIQIPHITRLTGLEKIRAGWNIRKRQPLRDLIRECRYRLATNPRDKVYSLIGLMGDQMNEYLTPDYTKPIGEVYANTTLHFITQAGSIDPICGWQTLNRNERSWGLPSWAPDYSLDQDSAPFPIASIDGRECVFTASGYGSSRYTRDQPGMDWRVLSVSGLRIDTISGLSGFNSSDESFGVLEARWRSEFYASQQVPQSSVTQFGDCMDDLVHLVETESRSSPLDWPRLSSCLSLELYIQTLLSGRISARERLKWNDFLSSVCGELSNDPEKSEKQRQYISEMRAILKARLLHRRLAVTKENHVAAVPEETHLGDIICILFGCNIPVVLRELSDQTYRFVGECYIHKFMDGEAIAMQRKGKMQEQGFQLM